MSESNKKIRLATIWLEGCSGCHMSFLDMDERLLEVAEVVELVYSPYVDQKEFPENVDVTLVEGGLGSVHDVAMIKKIRERTRVLVALGDCAVTANVPSLRNVFPVEDVLAHGYEHTAADNKGQIPDQGVPALLPKVRPLHDVVKVDVFLPGCPPSADLIHFIVTEVLEGRLPGRGVRAKFG